MDGSLEKHNVLCQVGGERSPVFQTKDAEKNLNNLLTQLYNDNKSLFDQYLTRDSNMNIFKGKAELKKFYKDINQDKNALEVYYDEAPSMYDSSVHQKASTLFQNLAPEFNSISKSASIPSKPKFDNAMVLCNNGEGGIINVFQDETSEVNLHNYLNQLNNDATQDPRKDQGLWDKYFVKVASGPNYTFNDTKAFNQFKTDIITKGNNLKNHFDAYCVTKKTKDSKTTVTADDLFNNLNLDMGLMRRSSIGGKGGVGRGHLSYLGGGPGDATKHQHGKKKSATRGATQYSSRGHHYDHDPGTNEFDLKLQDKKSAEKLLLKDGRDIDEILKSCHCDVDACEKPPASLTSMLGGLASLSKSVDIKKDIEGMLKLTEASGGVVAGLKNSLIGAEGLVEPIYKGSLIAFLNNTIASVENIAEDNENNRYVSPAFLYSIKKRLEALRNSAKVYDADIKEIVKETNKVIAQYQRYYRNFLNLEDTIRDGEDLDELYDTKSSFMELWKVILSIFGLDQSDALGEHEDMKDALGQLSEQFKRLSKNNVNDGIDEGKSQCKGIVAALASFASDELEGKVELEGDDNAKTDTLVEYILKYFKNNRTLAGNLYLANNAGQPDVEKIRAAFTTNHGLTLLTQIQAGRDSEVDHIYAKKVFDKCRPVLFALDNLILIQHKIKVIESKIGSLQNSSSSYDTHAVLSGYKDLLNKLELAEQKLYNTLGGGGEIESAKKFVSDRIKEETASWNAKFSGKVDFKAKFQDYMNKYLCLKYVSLDQSLDTQLASLFDSKKYAAAFLDAPGRDAALLAENVFAPAKAANRAKLDEYIKNRVHFKVLSENEIQARELENANSQKVQEIDREWLRLLGILNLDKITNDLEVAQLQREIDNLRLAQPQHCTSDNLRKYAEFKGNMDSLYIRYFQTTLLTLLRNADEEEKKRLNKEFSKLINQYRYAASNLMESKLNHYDIQHKIHNLREKEGTIRGALPQVDRQREYLGERAPLYLHINGLVQQYNSSPVLNVKVAMVREIADEITQARYEHNEEYPKHHHSNFHEDDDQEQKQKKHFHKNDRKKQKHFHGSGDDDNPSEPESEAPKKKIKSEKRKFISDDEASSGRDAFDSEDSESDDDHGQGGRKNKHQHAAPNLHYGKGGGWSFNQKIINGCQNHQKGRGGKNGFRNNDEYDEDYYSGSKPPRWYDKNSKELHKIRSFIEKQSGENEKLSKLIVNQHEETRELISKQETSLFEKITSLFKSNKEKKGAEASSIILKREGAGGVGVDLTPIERRLSELTELINDKFNGIPRQFDPANDATFQEFQRSITELTKNYNAFTEEIRSFIKSGASSDKKGGRDFDPSIFNETIAQFKEQIQGLTREVEKLSSLDFGEKVGEFKTLLKTMTQEYEKLIQLFKEQETTSAERFEERFERMETLYTNNNTIIERLEKLHQEKHASIIQEIKEKIQQSKPAENINYDAIRKIVAEEVGKIQIPKQNSSSVQQQGGGGMGDQSGENQFLIQHGDSMTKIIQNQERQVAKQKVLQAFLDQKLGVVQDGKGGYNFSFDKENATGDNGTVLYLLHMLRQMNDSKQSNAVDNFIKDLQYKGELPKGVQDAKELLKEILGEVKGLNHAVDYVKNHTGYDRALSDYNAERVVNNVNQNNQRLVNGMTNMYQQDSVNSNPYGGDNDGVIFASRFQNQSNVQEQTSCKKK